MARILIVDDDELARFTLREILEEVGHEVSEAASGDACLEMQKRTPFDVVVTDIIMPGREGIETVMELKRAYPDLRVIAISGGGRTHNMSYLDFARRFGADATLAKPFTGEELLAAVDGTQAGG